MSEEMKAFRKNGKIIIEIPEDNLVFAMENSPRGSYKITNREIYLDNFTKQLLEYHEGYDDDPMLFKVFDDITEHTVEYGEEGIEPLK